MTRALVFAALSCVFVACAVSIKDAGCACDDAHPCRTGESCVGGVCVDPSGAGACASADAGVDAGLDAGADAGADAGVDAGVDAGACAAQDASWSQCRDGFGSFVDAGVFEGVVRADQTRLDATLGAFATPINAGPAGVEPVARGHVPATLDEGTLRGSVTFSALPNGIITVAALSMSDGGGLVDVYVAPLANGQHQLQLWCQPHTILAGYVDPTISPTEGMLQPSQRYDVRATWRAGEFCRLEVDGQLVSEAVGDAGMYARSVVDLRVGLVDQDPAVSPLVLVPSGASFEGWRLSTSGAAFPW
jgi:hypothetical protein